jgi:hypothetical protein
MIATRDLSEYQNLCYTLKKLHEKFLKRKDELKALLEETCSYRRKAFVVLAKANGLTRHLTGRQRQLTGVSYYLGEIKARVNQAGIPAFRGSLEDAENLIQADTSEKCRSLVELKRLALTIIGMIEHIKKNLLQLDLLEMRCRELIRSIDKALEAFRHEFRIIHRRIYPFWVFSFFNRSLRNLFGNTYFSFRDLDNIRALGNITGFVLKIADSPLV